ncbi:hypothetical protein HK100_002466 [Physocladia obscura]|uniref:Tubulin-specific chaperone D n=1 Tax=Physocladia obscura TaxID=109957 RepID=A0AAD5XE70_9FUNG|nr:hypothetical protein HK100_002466 [Physocladia obscura]
MVEEEFKEGEDAIGTHFEEHEEVIRLIAELVEMARMDSGGAENNHSNNNDYHQAFVVQRRIRVLLERYQEQPQLLDAHLENMTNAIVIPIREIISTANSTFISKETTASIIPAVRALFYVLNVVCSVRGWKTVVSFLPHDPSDLEPLLSFLARVPIQPIYWDVRYVLLLWLSLVVMVPFDLAVIDSSFASLSLIDTIVQQGTYFLAFAGKEYQGASILLTRVLTRRDTVNSHLPRFLSYCTTEALKVHLELSSINIFLLRGILHALCSIYKFGPRNLLLPTLSGVVDLCSQLSEGPAARSNSLVKKLICKLSQRVGLCFLKPKLAAWRYQRGSRSLAANLAKVTISNSKNQLPPAQGGIAVAIEDVDEDNDVPEEIESIIQLMLNGLRDKDTIVRWSAAKGVGRISARLPQEFATEVVASVINLFYEDILPSVDPSSSLLNLTAVSDSTWHGACLAVAELARRGLLMPEWLEKVVPCVSNALLFDQRRGVHSIGSHVRDAANYVCWSFFRAYDPALLVPHISMLSQRLIVSATLDREVNVRRAASAAFQEGVGRLGGSGEFGAVPNGIDVVTIADYFSVGNRTTSIREVAVTLSKYVEYRSDIILHVSQVLTIHWDKSMRVLASQALYKLSFVDLDFVLTNVLPYLISKVHSPDLIVRHGTCLALGEICLAWSQIRGGSSSNLNETDGNQAKTQTHTINPVWWNKDEHEKFIKLPSILPGIIRERPIPQLSLPPGILLVNGKLAIHNIEFDLFINSWWKLVHSTLEHRDESVQAVASKAAASLMEYCWPSSSWSVDVSLLKRAKESAKLSNFIDVLCKKLTFPRTVLLINDNGTVVKGPQIHDIVKQHITSGGAAIVDRFPRRGYAQVAGLLSASVRHVYGSRVVQCLIDLVNSVEGGGEDAEGRRNAVTSIVGIYQREVDYGGKDAIQQIISRELFLESLDALFVGLEDYSSDSRGDVGSWIREVCFGAWPILIQLFKGVVDASGTAYLCPETKARAIGQLLRQSLEKIDRVRESAGVALMTVIRLNDVDLGISNVARETIKHSLAENTNWLNTADVYPKMVKLLEINEFREDLLVGLVVSVGGISESLVRYSTSSLIEFVNSLPLESESIVSGETLTLQSFFGNFVELFSKPQYIKDRISVALIEVTDVLIGCGAIAKIAGDGEKWIGAVTKLSDVIKKEVFKCRDVKKLLAAIKVFIGLATIPGAPANSIRDKALVQLVIYLTHAYPRVRRASSEGLYIALTTGSDEIVEKYVDVMDEIEEVLLATDWDLPVAQLKGSRAKLAEFLCVKLPAVATK